MTPFSAGYRIFNSVVNRWFRTVTGLTTLCRKVYEGSHQNEVQLLIAEWNTMTVKYTVVLTSYQMAETIERAVRSVVSQLDDRFELLVVDGGSTDGSLEILHELADEFEIVRLVVSESGELSDDRNLSIREAHGEYIMPKFEADDVYEEGILDFVTLYHKIEKERGGRFHLKGDNINMSPKQLLLDYGPYRPGLNRGEDQDFWRRLFANDEIVWLDHNNFSKQIGYEPDISTAIRYSIDRKRTAFRTGISPSSYLRWSLKNKGIKFAFDLFSCGIGYIKARNTELYSLPDEMSSKGDLEQAIEENRTTVPELEEKYRVDICSSLSRQGRKIFCQV